MEWTSIVVAAIAMLGTCAGSFYGIKKSTSLIEYRIDKLEGKVDLHNNLVDRMYRVEKGLEVKEEQVKVVNHRIADLEAREGKP
jgi:hypothetical protein